MTVGVNALAGTKAVGAAPGARSRGGAQTWLSRIRHVRVPPAAKARAISQSVPREISLVIGASRSGSVVLNADTEVGFKGSKFLGNRTSAGSVLNSPGSTTWLPSSFHTT